MAAGGRAFRGTAGRSPGEAAAPGGVWAELWRRLEQPGDRPLWGGALDPLITAALVAAEPTDPANPEAPVGYQIHPGIAEAVHTTPQAVCAAVDAVLTAWWNAVARWGVEQERAGQRLAGPGCTGKLCAIPCSVGSSPSPPTRPRRNFTAPRTRPPRGAALIEKSAEKVFPQRLRRPGIVRPGS
ncbi:MAG TPA: hypothetical protein VFQ77_16540 [Pseudonocardiaceae bacterium]|nr:hypothetical protein [Pseudonocardiaceae bacterium]